MNYVRKIFNNIETFIMVAALPLMLTFVFTAIVVRYFGIGSMSWSDEASRFLMIWLVLAGAAALFKNNGHLGVGFFVNLLPVKIKMIFFYIRSSLIILFGLFVAYYSITIMLNQLRNSQLSPNLSLPMWVVYASLIFFGVFTVIRTIQMTYTAHKNNDFHTEETEEVIEG